MNSRSLLAVIPVVFVGLIAGTSSAAPQKSKAPAAPSAAPSSSAAPVDDPSVTPTTAPGRSAPDGNVRCKPSCYHTERPVKDFGKHVTGCAYYEKNVYQDPTVAGWGPSYMGPSVRAMVSVPSCKFPTTGGPKWASMEAWVRKNLGDMKPGDTIVVPADESWEQSESTDGSISRAVTFRWYTKSADLSIGECGTPASTQITCEADGSPAARAINVAHYRLEEAKKLKAASNNAGCQQAALESIATSRGFAKDGVGLDYEGDFKTRFDGTLTKKQLVAKVASLGKEAEAVFKTCGGTTATTTQANEQAYHDRW